MCLDSKFVVVVKMFPCWPHKNIPSPLKHQTPEEKFAALELQGALEHPCKWKNRGKNSVWFSREVLGSTWGIIRLTRGTSWLFFTIVHTSCECIAPIPEERAGTQILSTNAELQINQISLLYPAPCCRGLITAGRAGSPSSPLVCIGKEVHSTSQGSGNALVPPLAQASQVTRLLQHGSSLPLSRGSALLCLHSSLDLWCLEFIGMQTHDAGCHDWCPSPAAWINKTLILDPAPPVPTLCAGK